MAPYGGYLTIAQHINPKSIRCCNTTIDYHKKFARLIIQRLVLCFRTLSHIVAVLVIHDKRLPPKEGIKGTWRYMQPNSCHSLLEF